MKRRSNNEEVVPFYTTLFEKDAIDLAQRNVYYERLITYICAANLIFSVIAFILVGWVLNQRSNEFQVLVQSGNLAMDQIHEAKVINTVGDIMADWRTNKQPIVNSLSLFVGEVIEELNKSNTTQIMSSASMALVRLLEMVKDFAENPTLQLQLNNK